MPDNRMINYKLCEQYPFLIPRDHWTGAIDKDYDYSYFPWLTIPKGWIKLFMQMCVDIRQPLIDANCLDKMYFIQVKEKYNEMRCYMENAPKNVKEIIYQYEYVSRYVCTICGAPAKYLTAGYIASYCENCCPTNEVKTPIEFNPIYSIIQYNTSIDKKEETILTYDCSSIWNKLYNNEL